MFLFIQKVYILLSQTQINLLMCILHDLGSFLYVQFIFVVIDHENPIVTMVIHTVPLPEALDMYRSNLQFLVKVKASGTGKLFDSLPRKGALTKLCSGVTAVIWRVNY